MNNRTPRSIFAFFVIALLVTAVGTIFTTLLTGSLVRNDYRLHEGPVWVSEPSEEVVESVQAVAQRNNTLTHGFVFWGWTLSVSPLYSGVGFFVSALIGIYAAALSMPFFAKRTISKTKTKKTVKPGSWFPY